MNDRAVHVILLDVGSTNTRAWLLRDGRIVERRAVGAGVRNTALEGSRETVRRVVREVLKELVREAGECVVAAAGMITSPQGLHEVPHVNAPASAADVARGAIWFDDPSIPHRILLVPGVRTADTAVPGGDAMRGEETLAFGLMSLNVLQPGERLLNIGSHWKCIDVDAEQRITRSRTSLGGETLHALLSATLLSASVPQWPAGELSTGWLEAGAAASREEGLLRSMFRTRLLDLGAVAPAPDRFAFLLGACIADDIRGLAADGWIGPHAPVAVCGAGETPSAWAHLLERHGCTARVIDQATMERGYLAGLSLILGVMQSIADVNGP